MGDASVEKVFGPLKAKYNRVSSDYLIIVLNGQPLHVDGEKELLALKAAIDWVFEQRR